MIKKCFVCQKQLSFENMTVNQELMLPVCNGCNNTEKEKKAVEEYNESLADGFVCGCI
jgi:NAD-dependent SIR2 family protein deacetylase